MMLSFTAVLLLMGFIATWIFLLSSLQSFNQEAQAQKEQFLLKLQYRWFIAMALFIVAVALKTIYK